MMNLDEIYDGFIEFGEPLSPQSLGWSTKEEQQTRFTILANAGIQPGHSVLDVGCGYGDFSYLLPHIIYEGIDARKIAIDKAKEKYPHKQFTIGTVFDVNKKYDWVVASGIFCFEEEQWEEETFKTLSKMYELCNKGVATNFLSSVNNENMLGRMKYVSPDYVIKNIIYKICSKFIVRHDYEKNDFTIYLYK